MNFTLIYPEAHLKSINKLLTDHEYRKDTVAFYAQGLSFSEEEKKTFFTRRHYDPIGGKLVLTKITSIKPW